MEEKLCDLKVHINGQHTFFLNQRILCSFSSRLKKMVKQEKRRNNMKGVLEIKIKDFPCGPNGFEMISRFCYNNGRIPMSPSNICILHCSALLLEMTEEMSASNLLAQAETFLDGLFYWTWDDILTSLKTCEPFFHIADSSGLLMKLISSLVSNISEHSEVPLSPSSSASPRTPDSLKHSFTEEWWFHDLSGLPANIISKILKTLGAYGSDNKNLILTRFLLNYLKKSVQRSRNNKSELDGLADTAVFGVVLMGRAAFSCRGLFWVLRIVSKFGLSKECRQKLEKVIGSTMDQATLDDLLVSGHDKGVYDVNLVLRLVRVFVSGIEEGEVEVKRMKKVGRLVDQYLGEISPDQGLKVSKFLAVAQSLPDSARDCFDGVYRALEIYLEAHPKLSSEDRTRLCRCLNYEKLTLEACKDLAKNPRIPPGAAIHAMVSQQSNLSTRIVDTPKLVADETDDTASSSCELSDDKEELKLNLQKMQNRVMELEKVCMEMKCQMTKMFNGRAIISRAAHQSGRGMTKLC